MLQQIGRPKKDGFVAIRNDDFQEDRELLMEVTYHAHKAMEISQLLQTRWEQRRKWWVPAAA